MYRADNFFLLCLTKRCIDLNNIREKVLSSRKGKCKLIFYVMQRIWMGVLFCIKITNYCIIFRRLFLVTELLL